MSWWVYMLRCGDGTLYTGATNNIQRRLAAHNSGRGAKYTRSRLPVELVWREEQPDKSAALRREAYLKTLTRSQKLALIARGERPAPLPPHPPGRGSDIVMFQAGPNACPAPAEARRCGFVRKRRRDK